MEHNRVLLLATVAAAFGLASLPTVGHSAVAKDFSACQKGLNKGGQKLAKSLLKSKLACAGDLLECKIAEETGGGSFAGCAAKPTLKCTAKIAKVVDKLPAKITKAANKKQCLALSQTQFRARVSGLGFRDVEQSCAAFSPPESIIGEDALASCITAAIVCRGDEILEQVIPRAYEVLTEAGVQAALPAGTFPCLEVRAPSPALAGAPAKELNVCQKTLTKNLAKSAATRAKGLLGCSDGFFACTVAEERGEADATTTAACAAKADAKCAALSSKISAQDAKTDTAIDAACGGVALADLQSALGFAQTCPAATNAADVRTCATGGSKVSVLREIGSVQPRSCALFSDAGVLAGEDEVCLPFCGNRIVEDGESCDDGDRDPLDTCTNDCVIGPTDSETVTIASGAAPADTPDGTPTNAVAPGSTLETRFGTTIFDLNNATYTRYFAPGAGDPDAVLVMIPGFAAGAQSFKYFAEVMVEKAAGEAGLALEVWAFDRRTNQLEDLEGVILAETEQDPLLGLDWFFGSEIGLSLDPRLSRRGVFHAGPDVAFVANFTPNVFARDIDAVVDAATALPGAPTVFLGGHSLGTTFTARYASTDFDTGAGVVAGHSKVAGLVLMEGGALFGSAATATPTDDELDLVIARADGGLYNAVLTGAPSCVDGTPCVTNADCVAVAPTAGALTSKCVEPVEAYTGAAVGPFSTVTPQIQAAGDITAIQGRVTPDSQTLVQQDFGSGAAVDLVSGLGLLGALAPTTTEAALGLFLDDDFSPQPAFRVSMGFTNNGNNVVIPGFDFLVAGAAGFDPVREWISVSDPMPSQATPDNGGPYFIPDLVTGVEIEVTPIETMFSLIRAEASNFGDWYFASSGLGVTAELGGMDTTPLSVGRGRADIENLTEAGGIDIPVIAFGGTNGLAPTPGSFKAFAEAIGPCTAPTCNGTPRIVNPLNVQTVYGGPDGGFEAHLSEGYAHIDVLTAPDDPAHNNVYAPLLDFLTRNTP